MMALISKKVKTLHEESAEILGSLLEGAKKLRGLNDKIQASKSAKQAQIMTLQTDINELTATEVRNERVAQRFEELVS